MIAIAVDDEALMLGALVAAIEVSPDITEVAKFSDCEEALEFAKNNPADIAFLDINMRGMGGLALAEKIISFRSDCKIVFCTGYEEYAIPAFQAIDNKAIFIVAGAPACMPELQQAGIENFIHVRVNILDTLRELNSKLGI